MKTYGYAEEACRLSYKWLYMITKIFSDFNGTLVEKLMLFGVLTRLTLNMEMWGLIFSLFQKKVLVG